MGTEASICFVGKVVQMTDSETLLKTVATSIQARRSWQADACYCSSLVSGVPQPASVQLRLVRPQAYGQRYTNLEASRSPQGALADVAHRVYSGVY